MATCTYPRCWFRRGHGGVHAPGADTDPNEVRDQLAAQEAQDEQDPGPECSNCGSRSLSPSGHTCLDCGAWVVYDPGPLSPPTGDEIAAVQGALDWAHEQVESLPEDVREAWREQWDRAEEFRGER